MPDVSFSGLAIVTAVAFAVPLLLGLVPTVRLPSAVLEILAGIVLGPSVLGWVEVDPALRVVSQIGLAFLLFLAGLEIDLPRMRGGPVRVAGLAFVIACGLALAAGLALTAAGQVESHPLLVAVILVATSLGLVIPVLKDARETETHFGQLVIGNASIAEFGSIILLSLFFSTSSVGEETNLLLLAAFVVVGVAAAVGLSRAGRSHRIAEGLTRLQDTTAQIRIRAALALMLAFVAMASRFGFETILGSFMAGLILRIADAEAMAPGSSSRVKLEAVGFGFFIPVFFVTSGVSFELDALFASTSSLLRVPLFLLALLLVGMVPALVYRRVVGVRPTVAAGLLASTSLPFIVAASRIGVELRAISDATAAALVAAGLLSVVIFPAAALVLLRRREAEAGEPLGSLD